MLVQHRLAFLRKFCVGLSNSVALSLHIARVRVSCVAFVVFGDRRGHPGRPGVAGVLGF